ncbi:HIT family protein [Segnochrobactraceae bacterium EtOH-i3]
MTYDPQNVFAKILRGELPCVRVYEDDNTLAFMDVMPQIDGHTLVIPKTPSRNLLAMAPEDLTPLILSAQKVGRAVKAAFDAPGLLVMQFNEPAAGQTVFHTHIHLLPRWEDRPLKPHAGTSFAAPEILEGHAKKIRAALAAGA